MINSTFKFALILLFIIMGMTTRVSAKNKHNIDSLIATHPTDTVIQFRRFCDISYYYRSKNKDIQKKYLDSALALKPKIHGKFDLAGYYTSLGHYYYKRNLFDSAIITYKKITSIIDSTVVKQYSQNNINLGRAFGRIDQYDSAIFYYQKSIKALESIDSTKMTPTLNIILAATFNNLGSVYLNTGNYNEAVNYYYLSLKLYDNNHKPLKSTSVLMNLGNIYLFHGEYDKALLEYNKALNILNEYPGKRINTRASLLTNMGICFKAKHETDTALVYYEKALKIRERIGPNRSVSGLYDNIGSLLKSIGEYDNALAYYNKALTIRKKGAGARDLASSYGNLGLLYVKTKDNKKAIYFLNKAIETSHNMHFVEIILVCKKGLSEAYKNIGNYKYALEYYIEYQEMNDSIHSLKLEEKLNDYKQKYESEKKDRLIERLEEDKKLADALDKKQKVINEKQRMMMNGLGGIALLLLVILFILQRYFKMKRESDRKLFEKTEQLNQQKTLELMKELEMSSFKSFIEGQEKERTRIAGDLHDRLGSLLSTVRLHFDSLDEALSNNPEAKQSHEFALKLLDSSVQEVRAVSRNLSKGVLTQFGLIAAVENMRDAINAAGKIKMEVLSSGVTSRLNPDVEINLFRVIQELITNVIRHAQTNEVFVQFNGAGNHFSVIVEDHGIGFDKNNIKSNGIGMSNLKTRIQAIGGNFDIDSIIGQGTTIIIDVPYNTETKNTENKYEE